MWCVRVDSDGRFMSARRRVRDSGQVCWTLAEWRQADRNAHDQFIVPDDTARAAQHAFVAACGLR